MFPTPFAYHRAESVADAVAQLENNPEAKILAGGHSLVPAMKLRLASPEMLVDISRIDDLRYIRSDGDYVHIGAMATYADIRGNAEIASLFPLLPEAIDRIGDQQVRARGTMVGSIVHADPAADLTAVFLALNGQVHVVSTSGERVIDASDLFIDLWTTSLEPAEVVVGIALPRPAEGTRMAYRKHAHPASGYAVVGVAAVLPIVEGKVSSPRLVVTGATSIPMRLTSAETMLEGNALDANVIAEAGSHASDGVEINGDTYAPEVYRSHLLRVMTKQVLEQAANR